MTLPRKTFLKIAYLKSAEETSTYSAMMRELNKIKDEELRQEFMIKFKDAFDEAVNNNLEDPQNLALMQSKKSLGSNINYRLLSLAQTALPSNSNPEDVGRTLAAIVKVILSRAPHEPYETSTRIKEKLINLNYSEMSQKLMPANSAYGQAITLVKTMLNGHKPSFIKDVMRNIVRFL